MRVEVLLVFVAAVAVGVPGSPAPRRVSAVRRTRSTTWTRAGFGGRHLVRRRQSELPLTLELLARELRSGVTLRQAFGPVAATADPVLGLDHMIERLAQGAGLVEAVDWWVRRLDPDDAAVVAGVFHLGAETGAAVADALDRAAAGVRARRELAGEVRALTAQSRASAVLVGLAPVGFGAVLALAEPAAMGFLFGSPLGLVCLLTGVLLDALGFWWMHRLVERVVP